MLLFGLVEATLELKIIAMKALNLVISSHCQKLFYLKFNFQNLKLILKNIVFSQQRCHYLWNILLYKWTVHSDESVVTGCLSAQAYRPRGIDAN